MKLASHPRIIHFYGVTKSKGKNNNCIIYFLKYFIYMKFFFILFLDESNYSLVLEYADGGTLEKHLRDNVTTLIKWESQLKFAKEIAGSVLCLHEDHKIIHGNLVSIIILFYKFI